jgi:hypothetical protein
MKSIGEYFPKEGFVGDLEVSLVGLQVDSTSLEAATGTYQFDRNHFVRNELPIDMVESVVKPKKVEYSTEGAEEIKEPESLEEAEQQLEEKVKEHLAGSRWEVLLDRVNEFNETISNDNDVMEDVIKQLSEERSEQAEKEHAEYLEKTMKEFHENFIKHNNDDETFTVNKAAVNEILQAKQAIDDYYTRLRDELAMKMYSMVQRGADGYIHDADEFVKKLRSSKL